MLLRWGLVGEDEGLMVTAAGGGTEVEDDATEDGRLVI